MSYSCSSSKLGSRTSVVSETDSLERLPRMSPVDDPVLPSGSGNRRRGPRVTSREFMVVAGLVLTLVSGLLLFFVYGLASLVPPDDPRYWSLVLERILRPEYGGWVAIPSLLGLLMGIG